MSAGRGAGRATGPGYGSDLRLWRDLMMRVAGMGKAHVKVGVLASKSGSAESGFDMVALAATHEFGSPKHGIPERSFIRRTFAEKPGELATTTRAIATKFVRGEVSIEKALNILGLWASNAVKNRVTVDTIPPPNAPATIARKGSDRPLVDTGRMINAVTWAVDYGGDE